MEFLSLNNPHFYFAIALALINSALMCFAGNKFLQIMQLSGYRAQAYFNWMKDTRARYISRTAMVSFLSSACMVVTNALLSNFSEYYSYVGFGFYIYFNIVFIQHIYSAYKKTPLVQTRRMNRLITTLFFLVFFFTIGLLCISVEYIPIYSYAIIGLVPVCLPILVLLANYINYPFEFLIKKWYIIRAKKELSKHKNLIKIGITGSYGKTSTKYILNKMLSQKYNVCMTPHSFNTPMGITKVVLKYLKPENEVLICEMGAKKRWEIKELCDIVHPDYALLTPIGAQHLESFGSIENIVKTKSELINYVDTKLKAFNGDNELTKKVYDNAKEEKIYSSLKDKKAYTYVKDIKVGAYGSKFTLVIDGEPVECQTKLLGKHNLSNIALCAGFAHKLGVSLEQICRAILELDCIPHRMELKQEKGLIILDNSYNSSVDGYKASLETLALFKKKTKIIVTPGIVELGDIEQEENKKFGQAMAKVADYVIIVNKVHQESIKEGLIMEGFDESKIILSDTLQDANNSFKNIIKKGDVILFENDLPDSYR